MRILVVLYAMLLAGCGPVMFVVDVTGVDQKLEKTVVEDEAGSGGKCVAIIDVTGMIYNASKPGLLREGENPVSALHEKLEKARADRNVVAVILRLNTPGGTVTASDMMYRQVKRFKEQTGKPVIVLMTDLAASGGYYLACAGDAIVAHPTTITGSIGVIVQTVSLQPALGRLGITTEAITSGPNKDMASMLGTMTPEHRALLQEMVNTFYGNFVSVVKAGRPTLAIDQIGMITDGRVFTGARAAELGLVDRVGDLYDAAALAKERAHVKAANLVIYHRPLMHVASPYASASTPVGGTQINMAQINLGDEGLPGFAGSPVGVYYLWHPLSP